MINEEEKFIFLHIPKTGGTSIEKAVMSEKWENTNNTRHYNIRRLGLTKKQCDNYTIFTVSRNPFTRIASTYNHFLQSPDNYLQRKQWAKEDYPFCKYVKNIEDYFRGNLVVSLPDSNGKGSFLYRAMTKENFYNYQNFNTDVKFILDTQHIETLKWWTKTIDGQHADCHILRFERLDSDWEKFKSKIRISSKLEKLNVLKTSGDDYMKYYDKDSKKIIQKLYAEELRNQEQ